MGLFPRIADRYGHKTAINKSYLPFKGEYIKSFCQIGKGALNLALIFWYNILN